MTRQGKDSSAAQRDQNEMRDAYFAMRLSLIFGFVMLLGAACAVTLPIAISGRVRSIGWSRWWAIAFAGPWVLFFCTAFWAARVWTMAALTVLIASQFPLLLIKGSAAEIASSDGSHL